MKNIKKLICVIGCVLLLCGCGKTEAKQIVLDTYNEYVQMYGDAWLWAYERAEDGSVCELEEGMYYKLNDSITSIEQIKVETEAICTKEYAKREFYDKLLDKELPYYLEKDGVVYLQQAEMPGIITGDIKEIHIIENKKDYVQAQLIGENIPIGDTITDITVMKEGNTWKVDNFVENLKE